MSYLGHFLAWIACVQYNERVLRTAYSISDGQSLAMYQMFHLFIFQVQYQKENFVERNIFSPDS